MFHCIRKRFWRCPLSAVFAFLALGACAHQTPEAAPVAGLQAAAAVSELAEAEQAQQLYVQGVEDLASGMLPEAQKAFGDLKTKHPYTRFAALAELRLADASFERSQYIEAVEAYRSFIKYHPHHEQVGYALYRIAEAYHAQLPSDYFFMPPGAEKDQSNIRLAIAAYHDFLAHYQATGPSADLAQQHLADCRRRLADHQLYVAQFYFARGLYAAAANRAQVILADFHDLGLDATALWIAGKAHLEMGNKKAALPYLERLVQTFPSSEYIHDARAAIAGRAG